MMCAIFSGPVPSSEAAQESKKQLQGAEAFVDLVCDLTKPLVQIITGTVFESKPFVNHHVLLIKLTDQRLITLPQQLLDAVALTNVSDQLDQSLVRFGSDSVGCFTVACYLDSDSAMVGVGTGNTIDTNHVSVFILAARRPRAVFLFDR